MRVVLLLTGLTTTLSAMDVKTYREIYKEGSTLSRQVCDTYLRGVGEGFSWANIGLRNSKPPLPPLFCAPEKIALQPENYRDLIDSWIAGKFRTPPTSKAELDVLPVEAILLDALQETFPCPNAERSKK